MRVVGSGRNVEAIIGFRDMARILASERALIEAHRGVIDAGKKTKTQVQRAVYGQMALKSGRYSSYVVRNTRGVPRRERLSYEIFGVKGGIRVENYKGLKVLARTGRASRAFNKGRGFSDRGLVRSGVWNMPRVFKRSFAQGEGFFAILPGKGGKAPKAFWTYGLKPDQPRGPGGRFAESGRTYGKVRRLFGPSLMKEIPQGETLRTFQRVAPPLLAEKVTKRMAKIMKF